MDFPARTKQLAERLEGLSSLSLAVSGGVDSLTLAAFAHNKVADLTLYHALSPAVPAAATQRLEILAEQHDWKLVLINAGELDDENYRLNPVNRCFYCKQNLYGEIRRHTEGLIASGTNLDDLTDFRPGLKAAEDAAVIHPFVESGFTKAMVRALAAELGLDNLATLPASPCLSSRVRTGVRIEGELLQLIDRTENILRQHFPDQTDVRCRVHEKHLVMQLAPVLPDARSREKAEVLIRECFEQSACQTLAEHIEWAAYLQGSAFVQAVNPARDIVHG